MVSMRSIPPINTASVSGGTGQLSGIVASDPKLQKLIAKPQPLSYLGAPANINSAPAVAALMPSVFDPAKAPPGLSTSDYTWTLWGHSVIPADERPGTMFAILAEGSAYSGNTKYSYRNGQKVEVKGQIIKIGIPRDHVLRDQGQKGDETDVPFTVHGKPGEVVKLRYVRISLNDKGEMIGGGTPDDSIRGGSGAYLGRQMAVKVGSPQKIISPEDRDRDYLDMIKYYFGGDTRSPPPALSKLAIESHDRGY